ncbi:beta-N-acetylhexosaminidase [Mucisphaera calidilacus]|uniref:Putative lipoprotein YbbD n=1 Tax=Mucisphaera calidilacus TaxID=2527982 RepID=A0A518C045_9BACT|nr:beta-N-acetylhexosaminidase [Mucisphaera calidilacus]QDU72594.1 putative lipoprotein YbbD precursor [Mucisphaera calidilacus]
MASDLQRLAARTLCVGFPGTEPSTGVLELIDRGVGGVVFFARNVDTQPNDVAALTTLLKQRAGDRPLILGVDQEGGRVQRLRQGFSELPPMRALGSVNDPVLARKAGEVLGSECRAVGFDLDFAPVLDVDSNPDNPIIATRSIARDAEVVTRLGLELIKGIQDAGVAACGKHFPGHGDTNQDSHLTLPTLKHDMQRLEAVELPPFRAAADADIASIMTAHIIFEAIDTQHPATMSQPVIHGLLRQSMGYDGVVVSDDLEMKAIANNYAVPEAAVHAIAAGVDLLLCCHTNELANESIDAIAQAVEDGRIPRERLEQANRRLDTLCQRFVVGPVDKPDLACLDAAEHRDVVSEIRKRAEAAALDAGIDPTEIMESIVKPT